MLVIPYRHKGLSCIDKSIASPQNTTPQYIERMQIPSLNWSVPLHHAGVVFLSKQQLHKGRVTIYAYNVMFYREMLIAGYNVIIILQWLRHL